MSDSLKQNKSAVIIGVVAVAAVVLLGCCGCGNTETDPKNDFLSQRYPYTAYWPTASGPQPVPFHNWNSDFFAIWCDADAAHVKSVLTGTGLYPVVTTTGRAIAGLWNYNYKESTGGPYSEAVIVLAATRDPNYQALADEPMEWVEALLFDGNFTSYVPKLWLNAQKPIDYGRDILGTDKYLASSISVKLPAGAAGPATVDVQLKGGKETVWKADIPAVGLGAALAANVGMMSAFSLKNLWTALQVPTINLPIVFPKAILPKHFDQNTNPEVLNVLNNSPPAVLQYWPQQGSGEATFVAGPEIAAYKPVPRLVQRASPGRFVMFPPSNVPPAAAVAAAAAAAKKP